MVIPFAKTNFRGQDRMFGIKPDDRRRHMYIIGKTGMGKTVLEQNMTIADIEAGSGLAVIDPHGEYAEELLDHIPSHRVNDVIYFNPADLDFPIAFNAVEQVAPESRHLVASGLMGVFKKIWPDVWSARMEYILNNTILALLEYPNSTLLGIMRMLSNKEYRKKVLEKVTDPVIKAFWTEEYAQYSEKFEKEAIAPIQNKVGQFIAVPLIRNIIGQTKSSINMREVMDTGKILIINLSKGRIGEDNSKLLGGMLVTKLQLAAMSRVDIPEHERRDFYLYVDEFQNFATDSFADILSEARKYRLDLILAHQYIAQLPDTVRDAVFGNIGTLISFRVGAEDAEFLEKEFMPDFTANDLVNLAKANIYLKLMIDGVASRPFSADTLAPRPKPQKSFKDAIIKVSRERYSKSRKEVEEKISRWTSLGSTGQSRIVVPNPQGRIDRRPSEGPMKASANRDSRQFERQANSSRDNRDNRDFPKPKLQTFYKPFQKEERVKKEKEPERVNLERPLKEPAMPPKKQETSNRVPEEREKKPVVNPPVKRQPEPKTDTSLPVGQNQNTGLSIQKEGGNRALPYSHESSSGFHQDEKEKKRPPAFQREFRNQPQRKEFNSLQRNDEKKGSEKEKKVLTPVHQPPVAVNRNKPISPISLKQALLEKEATSFGSKPAKKEVDRSNLKKLIEASLDSLEKEKNKNNQSPNSPVPEKKENNKENKNFKQAILKPGEKIFFTQKKNRT